MCLSRERDQSIIIRGDIIVTVLDIRGHHVRLGITAPDDVSINREEIQSRIDRGEQPRRNGRHGL